MKKTILAIALFIPMAMLVSCGGEKPAEGTDATTEAVTEEAAVINTTHAYVCPMNCENSASNDPGTCSVCGMDLVKNSNYAGATDQAGGTDSLSAKETDGMSEDHSGHDH